jgi:hypothetical protein
MTRVNNWQSNGRISWRMASFKSFNVWVGGGVVSVNTRFQIPQRKIKSYFERSGERGGPRHVSETGNEVPGKHFSNRLNRPTQSKRMPTTSFHSLAYLLSTTHSEDVSFPWVTLYEHNNYNTRWKNAAILHGVKISKRSLEQQNICEYKTGENKQLQECHLNPNL